MKPCFRQRGSAALVGLAVVACLGGCATVKTKDEMSGQEIRALDESQGRINTYRERLRSLEKDRAANALGQEEFAKTSEGLNGLIEKEIALQKAIIRKDPGLAAKAQNLLGDIGKIALFSVVAVGALAMETLKSLAEAGATFSP